MEKVIKVLHTEWSLGWGGQEIRILAESKAFIDKGYEMIIAAQPNSNLYKKSNQDGVPTFPLKMNKGVNFLAIFHLVRYIKKNKIDIIHTHSSVDSRTAGLAAKISGIKVVRSRHISLPISKSWVTWWQYMKLADKVITSGRDIRNSMITDNKMLPQNIASAPAGADTIFFSEERELPNIRPEYNLSESDFVVGIVSVLRSWKGHKYLIEAIKMATDEIPNIRLIIVGAGPQKENIEQLIHQLQLEDKVVLTGYQPDPAIFYKAMDLMVLPSYLGEATSQVLPQAMLMGRPVISTDAGGLSEVVIHNQTGLIVPIKNSHAIYKAIKVIYEDLGLRKKLIKNGKEHALNFFTFDQMINTTESVYKEVIGR
jgi:glycosyltransferase involved in cell wall biosynthesis